MDFEQLVEAWKQAELLALAAEEAIVSIVQCATFEGHDMLAKAIELRAEADRMFERLAAHAAGQPRRDLH